MTTFIILGVVLTPFVLFSLVVLFLKSVDKAFVFSLEDIGFTEDDVMNDLVYRKMIDRDLYRE